MVDSKVSSIDILESFKGMRITDAKLLNKQDTGGLVLFEFDNEYVGLVKAKVKVRFERNNSGSSSVVWFYDVMDGGGDDIFYEIPDGYGTKWVVIDEDDGEEMDAQRLDEFISLGVSEDIEDVLDYDDVSSQFLDEIFFTE